MMILIVIIEHTERQSHFNWIQETDYDEYTKQRGSLIYTYTMPAGQTYVSLTYGDGYTPPFCKEERWCTSGSGDGIITPAVAY